MSTANSGRVSPPPLASRSMTTLSVGSDSSLRSSSPLLSSRLHELHGIAVLVGALLAHQRSRGTASADNCCAARGPRLRPSSSARKRVAVGARQLLCRSARASAILMLTSMSEELTPAELSTASVLMRPPASANSMRALLRDAEIGALADDLRLELGRIDAHRVIGAVAGIGVGFVRRLHIGADAAEPQEIGLALEQRMHELLRRRRVGPRARSAPSSRRLSGIALSERENTPPPLLISDLS